MSKSDYKADFFIVYHIQTLLALYFDLVRIVRQTYHMDYLLSA
jgi:hypothetical protein